MKKQLVIITDADAIVALANENDGNHGRAKEISIKLETLNARVFTPVTALAEALTVLKRKLKKANLVEDLIEQCKNGMIPLVAVDEHIVPIALSYFDPDSSKKDTFFDSIIAAMAKIYKAEAIFSFDQWYKKQGLNMTGDLEFLNSMG